MEPINKDTFLVHKDSGDFVTHWSKEIERHKSVLLPWYRERVSFPIAPFGAEEIESYVRDVRPYLTRSKQVRFWSPIGAVAVGVLGLSTWQYGLHQEAVDIENRARGVGWSLDISGPPYDAGEVSRYASEVSESEGNQARAEVLFQTLGKSIDFPWSTVRLRELELGLTTARVSGGRFMMGCLPSEGDCSKLESPRHEVVINHDMIVMSTEVTQGLYERVTGSNPSAFSSCGKDCPVEKVSWYDAVSFANRLSVESGLSECYRIDGEDVSWSDVTCSGWRLPTEAEWEYLARGGEEHLYAGSNSIGDVAWYDGNSRKKAHPVSQKQANGFGLYDMSGNVYEWCWDRWKRDYSSGAVTDPRGPSSGSSRVGRGGGWRYGAGSARAALRASYPPSGRENDLGFRLLRRK